MTLSPATPKTQSAPDPLPGIDKEELLSLRSLLEQDKQTLGFLISFDPSCGQRIQEINRALEKIDRSLSARHP